MKLSMLLFLTLASCCLLPSQSSAGIISGDTVDLELWSSQRGSFGVQSVIASPGTDANYFSNQLIDINFGAGNDIFTVSSTSGFTSIDGFGGFIEWRLSDLDFTGGEVLTGINFVQPYSNVVVQSLGPDSVTFRYNDIAIPAGTYFQAQFITSSTNVIPEPSSFLAFAICGSGLLIRRRRS